MRAVPGEARDPIGDTPCSEPSVALTVKTLVLRAKSSDQREQVIRPVRQHRFGWRSYRPVARTVRTLVLRAKSSDQRERVIRPVRKHRFGWRSYRPV